MSRIIKAAQVVMAHQVGRVYDLTQQDTGVTREEREALIGAGQAIASARLAPVISLNDYRGRRPGRREGSTC